MNIDKYVNLQKDIKFWSSRPQDDRSGPIFESFKQQLEEFVRQQSSRKISLQERHQIVVLSMQGRDFLPENLRVGLPSTTDANPFFTKDAIAYTFKKVGDSFERRPVSLKKKIVNLLFSQDRVTRYCQKKALFVLQQKPGLLTEQEKTSLEAYKKDQEQKQIAFLQRSLPEELSKTLHDEVLVQKLKEARLLSNKKKATLAIQAYLGKLNPVKNQVLDKSSKICLAHFAALGGQIDLLNTMQINQDIEDYQGAGLLHYAAQKGQLSCIEGLLKKESFVVNLDKRGLCWQDYAARHNQVQVLEKFPYLDKKQMIRQAVEARAVDVILHFCKQDVDILLAVLSEERKVDEILARQLFAHQEFRLAVLSYVSGDFVLLKDLLQQPGAPSIADCAAYARRKKDFVFLRYLQDGIGVVCSEFTDSVQDILHLAIAQKSIEGVLAICKEGGIDIIKDKSMQKMLFSEAGNRGRLDVLHFFYQKNGEKLFSSQEVKSSSFPNEVVFYLDVIQKISLSRKFTKYSKQDVLLFAIRNKYHSFIQIFEPHYGLELPSRKKMMEEAVKSLDVDLLDWLICERYYDPFWICENQVVETLYQHIEERKGYFPPKLLYRCLHIESLQRKILSKESFQGFSLQQKNAIVACALKEKNGTILWLLKQQQEEIPLLEEVFKESVRGRNWLSCCDYLESKGFDTMIMIQRKFKENLAFYALENENVQVLNFIIYNMKDREEFVQSLNDEAKKNNKPLVRVLLRYNGYINFSNEEVIHINDSMEEKFGEISIQAAKKQSLKEAKACLGHLAVKCFFFYWLIWKVIKEDNIDLFKSLMAGREKDSRNKSQILQYAKDRNSLQIELFMLKNEKDQDLRRQELIKQILQRGEKVSKDCMDWSEISLDVFCQYLTEKTDPSLVDFFLEGTKEDKGEVQKALLTKANQCNNAAVKLYLSTEPIKDLSFQCSSKQAMVPARFLMPLRPAPKQFSWKKLQKLAKDPENELYRAGLEDLYRRIRDRRTWFVDDPTYYDKMKAYVGNLLQYAHNHPEDKDAIYFVLADTKGYCGGIIRNIEDLYYQFCAGVAPEDLDSLLETLCYEEREQFLRKYILSLKIEASREVHAATDFRQKVAKKSGTLAPQVQEMNDPKSVYAKTEIDSFIPKLFRECPEKQANRLLVELKKEPPPFIGYEKRLKATKKPLQETLPIIAKYKDVFLQMMEPLDEELYDQKKYAEWIKTNPTLRFKTRSEILDLIKQAKQWLDSPTKDYSLWEKEPLSFFVEKASLAIEFNSLMNDLPESERFEQKKKELLALEKKDLSLEQMQRALESKDLLLPPQEQEFRLCYVRPMIKELSTEQRGKLRERFVADQIMDDMIKEKVDLPFLTEVLEEKRKKQEQSLAIQQAIERIEKEPDPRIDDFKKDHEGALKKFQLCEVK